MKINIKNSTWTLLFISYSFEIRKLLFQNCNYILQVISQSYFKTVTIFDKANILLYFKSVTILYNTKY